MSEVTTQFFTALHYFKALVTGHIQMIKTSYKQHTWCIIRDESTDSEWIHSFSK